MKVFNSLLVMLFVKIVLWSPFRSTRAFQRTALETFTTTRQRRLGKRSFTATAHDKDDGGGAAPQQQSSSLVRNNNNKVHTVTWKTPNEDKDIIFLANHGELLRTAALRQGLASPHNDRANLINCRGLGTCGTCAVQLSSSSSSLDNDDDESDDDWIYYRNAVESFRLTVPPGHSAGNAQRLRLACQVPVQGNVTVQKYNGFWGQYDTLVHPSLPTQPLGLAEFILDRKSPPRQE